MKKLIISMILAAATVPALAQHRHHPGHWNHRPHWHHGHGWLVPALIGGTVVYMATRPSQVVVQPQPVVIQDPPVVLQSNQVVIDGIVYNKVKMVINGVEQDVLVKNVQVSNLGSN